MTPKEKAKELFLKFHGFSIDDINTKQCALIAVDEILNEPDCSEAFWEDVKRELELL